MSESLNDDHDPDEFLLEVRVRLDSPAAVGKYAEACRVLAGRQHDFEMTVTDDVLEVVHHVLNTSRLGITVLASEAHAADTNTDDEVQWIVDAEGDVWNGIPGEVGVIKIGESCEVEGDPSLTILDVFGF